MAGGNNVETNSNIIKFYEKMNSFRAEGKHCDVTVLAGENEKRFQCHRVILASASEFFDKMFSGSFKESKSSEVSLKEMNAVFFENILNFIYTGSTEITKENVYGLLQASEFLDLECLQDLCIAYVENNMPTVHDIINILLFACNTEKPATLIHTMMEYTAKNFNEISKLKNSVMLPSRVLQLILKHKDLEKNDELIADFLVKWVKVDMHKREKLLSDILHEIDLKVPASYMVKLFSAYAHHKTSENDHEVEKSKEEMDGIVDDEIDSKLDLSTLELSYVPHKDSCDSFYDCNDIHYSFSVHAVTKELELWKSVRDINTRRYFYCREIYYKSVLLDGQQYNLLSVPGSFQFSVNLQGQRLELKTPPWQPQVRDAHAVLPIGLISTPTTIYMYNIKQLYRNTSTCNTFYKYNRDANDWSPVPEINHSENVSDICSASLGNLLYSFSTDPSSTGCHAQFYDERVGQWLPLPQTLLPHCRAAACVYNGKLYLSGGAENRFTSEFEVFDPAANKWHQLASMPRRKENHVLIPYQDNLWAIGGTELPVFGKNNTCVYDPKNNSWSSFTPSSEVLRARVLDAIVL